MLATFFSKALTEGSCLKTSSPTSACIMASNMPGDGLVTVSLIRFIFIYKFQNKLNAFSRRKFLMKTFHTYGRTIRYYWRWNYLEFIRMRIELFNSSCHFQVYR